MRSRTFALMAVACLGWPFVVSERRSIPADFDQLRPALEHFLCSDIVVLGKDRGSWNVLAKCGGVHSIVNIHSGGRVSIAPAPYGSELAKKPATCTAI